MTLLHLLHQPHRKAVTAMRTGTDSARLHDIGAIAGGSRGVIGDLVAVNDAGTARKIGPAEIYDLHVVAVARNKDVARFQVAMKDQS